MASSLDMIFDNAKFLKLNISSLLSLTPWILLRLWPENRFDRSNLDVSEFQHCMVCGHVITAIFCEPNLCCSMHVLWIVILYTVLVFPVCEEPRNTFAIYKYKHTVRVIQLILHSAGVYYIYAQKKILQLYNTDILTLYRSSFGWWELCCILGIGFVISP